MLSLSSDSEAVEINRGPVEIWYADCPLSPSNSTQIVLESRDGAVAASNEVLWTEWNLFDAPTNSVTLRAGDSLLLNAYDPAASSGTAEIEIVGVTNYTAAVGAPVPHEFEEPGDYTVAGVFGGISTQLAVRAVSSRFSSDPICFIGQTRRWDCPGLSTNAVVEADPGIGIDILEGEPGISFSLTARDTRERFTIARLGEDGPVTDNARVKGTRMETTAGIVAKVVEHFDDGSELIEYSIWMDEVPDDIEIRLHIFVGGVTFLDGTLNKILTAEDFGEDGSCTYRMVRAPGRSGKAPCHTMKFFQGDTQL